MKLDSHGQPRSSVNSLQNTRKAVNELYGLIQGMLADRTVTDAEILFLANWLSRHLDILDEFPVYEVAPKVAQILDDGVIEEDEARELATLLEKVVGGIGLEGPPRATRSPVEDTPIVFRGRSFCFTGKFQYGPRKRCQDCTSNLGAVIHDGVTLKLDYLVIGTLASRDWAQTNHGRKIETVVHNRRQGAGTVIVAEEHWARCLESAMES